MKAIPTALGVGVFMTASSVYGGDFLGFSSATPDGAAGYRGMMDACQASFPDSRICNSREMIESGALAPNEGSSAWVQPYWVPGGSGAYDITGSPITTPGNLTCNAWGSSSSDDTGLSVHGGAYNFGPVSCDHAQPVACCRATKCFAFPD